MKNSSPKNQSSSQKPRTKIQRSSNKKSMPPKPSKKESIKSQQPFVNPFSDVKQLTIKQQKAAEKLVQLLEIKLQQHIKQIIMIFNLDTKKDDKTELKKIPNVTDQKTKDQLRLSLNVMKNSQRRSSIQQQKDEELEEALSKQQIQQLEEGFRQLDPDNSTKKLNNPYQSVDYIKSKQDIQLNSARSMNSKKLPFKKDQKQPSIDLTKNDGQDLKKISLSNQTKQALVKLQKYDKEFSRTINDKTLKSILDIEQKRQQKIKSIHRGMRTITYDNELTVGCIVNIMKYHNDISKQIKQRQLLLEKNQQLQIKITNITKTKDDQIKQLKASLKSKFGDQGGRNRLLDVEIKDFKKGNELLITALNEGNIDKAKKLIQPQIKKLTSSSNNKQIAFERKELLQVIFGLLNQQNGIKLESSIQSSSTVINLISMLNTDLSPIFVKQSSIQKNISQLEKCRRQIEPKIQDTKLYETKQLYQTLSQGCNYIINLYQQLRQKTNTLTSLNRKIADMERVVERTDRLRVESVQKGDKIIEGLKDGLQRERRNSREIIKKINSSSKQLNQQKQKNDAGRLSLVKEQWEQVVKNIIDKLESNDLTWFSEIPNLKKRFLNKKEIDNELKIMISHDITLFEIMTRQNKHLQKVEKQNQGLEKRLSSDQKLQFKPNQIQKKYVFQKQKAEQLLLEKNALIKQLKQLQKQNQKPKDPQFDQIIHINKLCFSIESIIKTPFNRQIWSKLQTKLQSKAEFKNLNSVSDTLQTLYNKLFDYLLSIDISTKLNKQSRLKPAVKQIVKKTNTSNNNDINQKILNQILQLIKSIIQNQFEIQKYIQLVNSLPILIDSLTQKILENQQNTKTIEQLQNQISQMNIRMMQIQFQLSKRVQLQKQSNNQYLNDQAVLIQIQQLKKKCKFQQDESRTKIEQLQQKIKREKQSTFYRNKTLSELHRQVDELKESQIKSIKKIEQLQEQLFEKQNIQQLEQAQQTSNIRSNEQSKAQTRQGQKNYSNTIYIQTETELPQFSEKQISLQNHQSSHEQNQTVINQLQQLEQIRRLKDDVSLKDEHICRLKKWVLDKQAIITNLQNSQASLKTQLAILKQSFSQTSENSSPSVISSKNNQKHVNNIGQQKDDSINKIKQLEDGIKIKQQQSQRYKELSEKHRMLFEGCCKQMQQLHLNSQQEMQSLSQMHLKNQSLLQDEINLLKTQKSKLINKLKQVQLQANQLDKQINNDQKQRLLVYQTLENEYNELANINQIANKEVRNLEQQNIMLKERIIANQKDRKQQQQISEDMRKSFSSVLDKRRKRLQSRASNKNNIAPSESGFQLSAKLTTLLQNQGKLPSSALKVIIEAINKLIVSNKKLIERVKRTERQNNALYEAINHITENQQDLGQGISIIMHLQQVLTGLAQWLDVQQIANQQELKLAHFFQRLQGCLSKTNYFRYIQIFQEFLQHTVVMVFQKSQQQLQVQNSQIDSLKQKLIVALDEHLHDIVDEGATDGDDEGKILNQVRILLGVYLKTKNIKVIEDLVAILNIDEVSFG